MDNLKKFQTNQRPGGGKVRNVIRLYSAAWRLAWPLLRLNKRLKEGLAQRRLIEPLPAADLWIQAASGGEAYLAATLIEQLRPAAPIRVLVTTNTRQGIEILEKELSGLDIQNTEVLTAYFPFDRPVTMANAVEQVKPDLVVLLETEIWPGLLYACKSANRPVIIINGRMTPKSFSRYLKIADHLHEIGPDLILAISYDDGYRFGRIFGKEKISIMSNIKFDRISTHSQEISQRSPTVIPSVKWFLVLGSIRQEEEAAVASMISAILEKCPDTVMGLFPRHMHRINAWKYRLNVMEMNWCLRSTMKKEAQPGQIILWDVFGELADAYASATAVFVGGSLAPLGGQNYLEPLIYGNIPVIGPSHENFAWIGEQLFYRGLARRTENARHAAEELIRILRSKPARTEIQSEALDYIRSRQGGTQQACGVIRQVLAYQKNRK